MIGEVEQPLAVLREPPDAEFVVKVLDGFADARLRREFSC